MRARSVVIGIIGVSFFVIAGAVLSDLSSRGVPSSEQCAALWNDSINAGNRSIAAGWNFDMAIVSGWLAKERFPGCGVLFLRSDGKPWLSFSGWLHQGRVDTWDLVSGKAWRSDSPEGGPENPNAIVTDWGRVRLEG
jgi:hypothetical protein